MAQQAWGIYNPAGHGKELEEVDNYEEDEDVGFPGFNSSQGTTSSTSSFETTGYSHATPFGDIGLGNKRRFEEEVEDDVVVRSMGGRAIAVPRRKRDGKVGGGGVPAFAFGQENGNDFRDAEFLDYKLITQEVEMGGV